MAQRKEEEAAGYRREDDAPYLILTMRRWILYATSGLQGSS